MKTVVLALAVLIYACTTSAAEPIKFRGAYVGQPLSDFVNCDGTKGKALRPDYKVHGKLCQGGKGTVGKMKTHGFLVQKLECEEFLFDNLKLSQITICVPNDDWDKIRYDLTEKLGEPVGIHRKRARLMLSIEVFNGSNYGFPRMGGDHERDRRDRGYRNERKKCRA